MNLLLYARVLRKFFDFVAIRKGFKEKTINLLLYARVLRKFFDFIAIRNGFNEF